METICGYIVFRKPRFNFYKEGRGGFSIPAPRIDDLYYAGVDRMSWFDLEKGYLDGVLTDEMVGIRKELVGQGMYGDLKLLLNLDKAKKILYYSNRKKATNELCVVYSKKYRSFDDDVNISWLGVDIDCPGFGSMLREGIFTKPDTFPDFRDKINENGLFDRDDELLLSYIEEYQRLIKPCNLEVIDQPLEKLHIIHVGKVRL